jgi:aerobic carbon-monoxide dehydrogenase large subunit
MTYTYGSAEAHVAVDPGTGDVELLDCLVVADVGRIVNPLTLHGQAIGGAVQGLGGIFWSPPGDGSPLGLLRRLSACIRK